jgi:hypothetical protein
MEYISFTFSKLLSFGLFAQYRLPHQRKASQVVLDFYCYFTYYGIMNFGFLLINNKSNILLPLAHITLH